MNSARTRAALALLPMALAALGGAIDEYRRLGFTLWRAACRSAGVTAPALLEFTLQLLPTAVIGLLLGGVAVLVLGWLGRAGVCATRASLAAHLGCVLAMIVGMLLCTLILPPSWMLVVEPLLALGLSAWLFRALRPRASVGPRTSTLPSA